MDVDDDDGGSDIPEWIVTFGDMMSLLLTFFIMLVSMSELKQDEAYELMLESMRRQFGPDASLATLIPGNAPPANSTMRTIATAGRAKREDLMRGGNPVKSVSGDHKTVRVVRPGPDTTVGGVVFFNEDSPELTDEAKTALRQIAVQIAGKPQKVEVRGHASRKPVIGGGDHWSLAYERGRRVMAYLIERGISAERIRLGSAGSNEPLDDRDIEESRRRNARVEVLMWDETTTAAN